MNRDEKAQVIAAIAERLGRTETVIATSFARLSVKELSELRTRLREADAEMTVVKNTLARRAVEASGRTPLTDHLKGPSALVWVDGDPAAAAKALTAFARTHQEAISVKGGLLGSVSLSTAQINTLATLPSREQLLGQLAGGMNAPLTNLAGGLSNLISGLARSLSALHAARASESPAS